MRNLSKFQASKPLGNFLKMKYALWFLFGINFAKSRFCHRRIRIEILRIFGAKIGRRLIIKQGIRIHFPWNFEVGDDCWIGEEVWFINHEKITIGSNVCISQRSIVCSGGHEYRSASLEYSHKPIAIRDGAWICLDAKVLPGVTIGECSVVSAGEVVRKSLPDYSILIDGQVRTIDPPK